MFRHTEVAVSQDNQRPPVAAALQPAGCFGCPAAGILTFADSQGDSRWERSSLKSNLSKAVEEGKHRWKNGGPALNEDTLPEDSAHVYSPKEHQIRQDEHGRREGTEEGEAAPLHRQGEILLNYGVKEG